MRGLPRSFWGELQQQADGTVAAWHPLSHQGADCAATTRVILDRSILRKRLATFGGVDALSDAQRDRLGVLAASHDLGKFSGFSGKPRLTQVTPPTTFRNWLRFSSVAGAAHSIASQSPRQPESSTARLTIPTCSWRSSLHRFVTTDARKHARNDHGGAPGR